MKQKEKSAPGGARSQNEGRLPLDPALATFIADVAAAFGPAPHLQSAPVFRAQVERLSTRNLPPRPPGMAVTDRIAPTEAGPVPLRLYRPRALAGDAAAPVLLYIHGGGWTVGSLDTHDPIVAAIAEETPCCVASVGYSLAPEHPFPAAYHEIAAAGAWLEANAGALGIDARRIAIGGDSCGANLGTAVAIAARDAGLRRYCFQLLIYGVFDTDFETPSMRRNAEAPFLDRALMIWFWRQYLGGAAETDDPRAVPLRAKDLRGLPPAFVSTAEYDPLLDEGEAYAARLDAAGVPVEYRRAPALMHGFMRVRRLSRHAEEEFAAVCRALARAFARPAKGSTMSTLATALKPAPHGGSIQLFYAKSVAGNRPTVERADGIYMWDTAGKRYIDACSGPVVSNIGHGNPRVLEAMMAQAKKVAYASRALFENQPNIDLAEIVTRLAGPGLERAFFVSGGSEANEAAIKLARQFAVVRGEAQRWKVIARNPGYHGSTLGAVAVAGDPDTMAMFGAQVRLMPMVPAPLSYRLPPNHDADSHARHCAAELEAVIRREGPESVLAFIMEPVGGLATGALVAPAHYYAAVRQICDHYGVFLIFDEVMSGAGRTGTFLAAEHWPKGRPDLVTLAKGISSGYTPLGAVLAPANMVEAVAGSGGFLHGHTYSANPLSCAIGLAVVREMVERDLMGNAARMGVALRRRLEAIKAESPIVGDVRGLGLLQAIEIVADKETKAIFAAERQAVYRIIELGIARGLLLYSRRTANGKFGEWLMLCPPLIVTEAEIDEIARLLALTLADYEAELRREGALR